MARRLRVVAGSAGGLRLVAPKGARPTTDRVKESLFASLGGIVADAAALDLFAGSGALGIEALSRGAREATFVDRDRRAADAMRVNLATTGFTDRAFVRAVPVETFLRDTAPEVPFGIVFLDPPYSAGAGEVADVLQLLDRGWVGPGGVVVVERRAGTDALEPPVRWQVARERRYGDTLTVVLTV
jgi:16S rRNA (guanine966-N2)-methyltransferase